MDHAAVLILPGWLNSEAAHWQSHWETAHGYTRVQQHDWVRPLRGDWTVQLEEAVLAARAPVVPVWCEWLADGATPLSLFAAARRIDPTAFLLESVTGGERWARYSFVGLGARARLRGHVDASAEVVIEASGRTPLPGPASTIRAPAVLAAAEKIPGVAPVRWASSWVNSRSSAKSGCWLA